MALTKAEIAEALFDQLGLLGELIIFMHAKAIKDYRIERLIQFRDDRSTVANRA